MKYEEYRGYEELREHEERREYAERLKKGTKELIDGIGTETEREQRTIKLIYGFVRAGFLECRAERGDRA